MLWIIGDRKQFNENGRVPTQRTNGNIVSSLAENTWQYATSLQMITSIAALLHDLGKATIGFQHKLRVKTKNGDPYRHEWISLRLFLLMIEKCKTNKDILERLANFTEFQQLYPNWYHKLNKISNKDAMDLSHLPLVGKWLAWLIVTHHRMPFLPWSYKDDNLAMRENSSAINAYNHDVFYKSINAIDKWVKNSVQLTKNTNDFWQLKASISNSEPWLKTLKSYAQKALQHQPLIELNKLDPFLLHMSRLSLMVADHNFSSLKFNTTVAKDSLIANTKSYHEANQLLDEHLIGVAKYVRKFYYLLPKLSEELPTIKQHKPFTARTTLDRFQWQNHAFDCVKSYQLATDEGGFFGVNMASTGAGKTLANGRIMYALADPKKGARFTIALGLRILTLQTGRALQQRMAIPKQKLAILVGGTATKTLFEMRENNPEDDPIIDDNDKESQGSESYEPLVNEYVECAIDDHQLGTIIDNQKAKQLLYTPLVVCTIDHLIQASECIRGGKYIAPTLRLLTSDLVLDEPDDFDHKDLPALARLVHLAGLYGSRVLLSSATLTPDLISGLFDAYQAGRHLWNQHTQPKHNEQKPIICGWFDEKQQVIEALSDVAMFRTCHNDFVNKRTANLIKNHIRRKGEVLELLDYWSHKGENNELDYALLGQQIMDKAAVFHQQHCQLDIKTNKNVSIGLVRFAQTKHLIAVAKAMFEKIICPDDTQIHIVVYHARQLLLLRSQLEEKLDRILDRSKPEQLFSHPEIQQVLQNNNKKNHIFMILGTPVTEVGRDHDYDWAIVEPSSMRSIIQLVGRVWRHRPEKIAKTANVAILPTNLRAISANRGLGKGQVCFKNPGFEQETKLEPKTKFLLNEHETSKLILQEQLDNINAIPRIIAEYTPNLAGLEHIVMKSLFIKENNTDNFVTSYWQSQLAYHLNSHLQIISPFRLQTNCEREYVCQVDNENNLQFCLAENAWQTPNDLCEKKENKKITQQKWVMPNPDVQPWLTNDVQQAFDKLAMQISNKNRYHLANEFLTVNLNHKNNWHFHPCFGFYEN